MNFLPDMFNIKSLKFLLAYFSRDFPIMERQETKSVMEQT